MAGNAYSGIEIQEAGSNTVGGSTVGAGNLISANENDGIWITGAGAAGNVVQGNEIGTDVTGALPLGNAYSGVQIDSGADSNLIGGTIGAAGNLITNNGGSGVVVGNSASDASVGNQITANRIFANSGQAIDLGNDGVTYNSSSPRQGPNNLQNFPIIVSTADGQLQGWLGGSTPDTSFRVDVYASADYGPGGAGRRRTTSDHST